MKHAIIPSVMPQHWHYYRFKLSWFSF